MGIILASQSPRRSEILKFMYDDFNVQSAATKEHIAEDDNIAAAVMALAFQKATAVADTQTEKHLIIAADTIVYCDRVLGKPKDQADAKQMLKMLSSKYHDVYTGVALIESMTNHKHVFYSRTRVLMHDYDQTMIDWYVAGGEPFDKAGAYGIQGHGALLVKAIEGDYYTVMGLPIAQLNNVIKQHFAAYAPDYKASASDAY